MTPIATIVRPWTMRSAAAERATPIRRLTATIPAAPAAEANQAAAPTGPRITAAASVPPTSSDSRIGKRLSNVTIEKPQNSSTSTMHRSTRDDRSSRSPSPMTVGTARTEAATARRSRARGTSVMSSATATRWTPWSANATSSGGSNGSIPATGLAATRAPDASAPTAIATLSMAVPRPRPCSISAAGSAASVASTYHASRGPESSARYTPWSIIATTNRPTESAIVNSPIDSERDDAGEQQHRSTAERIRQAAGRQLECEHDEALDREHEADLGQRQPARQRHEHEDREEQPDRQPAQTRQDQVAAASRPGVEGGHRLGSSWGIVWWNTSTVRASGSPGEGSR